MKKFFLIVLLPAVMGLNAQSFEKGQMDLNIGLGFGTPFAGGHYRAFPPLSASLEVGVTDAISIGGYLGYTSATWRSTGTDWCKNGPNWVSYQYQDDYRWSFYIFGVRGAYHFAEFVKNDKVDLYLGAMLGYNYATYTYKTNEPCRNNVVYGGPSYGGVAWSLYVGCRYRFTEKVGAFAELGYGISYLSLGVNFKLK